MSHVWPSHSQQNFALSQASTIRLVTVQRSTPTRPRQGQHLPRDERTETPSLFLFPSHVLCATKFHFPGLIYTHPYLHTMGHQSPDSQACRLSGRGATTTAVQFCTNKSQVVEWRWVWYQRPLDADGRWTVWVKESEGTTIDTLDFTLQVAKFLQCQPAYLNHASLLMISCHFPGNIVDGWWPSAESPAWNSSLNSTDYGTTLFSDSSYTMDLPSTKHMH
jgi:hypothetical protein